MIEVETPDGTVLEFPDNTPPDVMKGKAQEFIAAPNREPGELDIGVKPTTLEGLTGGVVTRPAFEMAGGMAGAAAGGVAAGVPTAGAGAIPGVIAGGALGSAAGSFTFDAVEQVARFLGAIEGELEPIEQRVERAAVSAAEDATFGMGFPAVGQALRLGKRGIGKILGVSGEEAVELAQAARRQGIGVGAIDVAQGIRGRVLRGSAKVLGLFPFFGAPFRKEALTKTGQALQKFDDTLNAFAPSATLSDDLGIDMVRAARGAQNNFRTTAGELYDNFRMMARSLDDPNIVPTSLPRGDDLPKGIKEAAADWVQEVQRGRITLKPIGDEAPEVLTGAVADELNSFLTKLDRLPDMIDPDQVVGLTKDLDSFVKRATSEGFDVARVVEVKKAIEESINSLQFAPGTGTEALAVMKARDTANTFFSKGITKFQTATAKKFEAVDRNIFKAGAERPGSKEADELGRVVESLRTPQAVDNLVELVGKENVSKGTRVFLDDAWTKSLVQDVEGNVTGLNFGTLGRLSGITSKESAKRAKAFKLFEVAGVDPKEFLELMKVSEKIAIPKDVNTFIARRAALGGLGAAIGGATAPSVLGASKLGAVANVLLLRQGMKLISSPQGLKDMKAVLGGGAAVSEVAKRAALGRLILATERLEKVEFEDFVNEQVFTTQEEPALDPNFGP